MLLFFLKCIQKLLKLESINTAVVLLDQFNTAISTDFCDAGNRIMTSELLIKCDILRFRSPWVLSISAVGEHYFINKDWLKAIRLQPLQFGEIIPYFSPLLASVLHFHHFPILNILEVHILFSVNLAQMIGLESSKIEFILNQISSSSQTETSLFFQIIKLSQALSQPIFDWAHCEPSSPGLSQLSPRLAQAWLIETHASSSRLTHYKSYMSHWIPGNSRNCGQIDIQIQRKLSLAHLLAEIVPYLW